MSLLLKLSLVIYACLLYTSIPVIVNSGKHWNKGIEHLALNSLFPQLSLIIRRQGGQAAHAVEKKPHVYPFFHLFFQELQKMCIRDRL